MHTHNHQVWTSCFIFISTIVLFVNTASENGKQKQSCTCTVLSFILYTVSLSSSISRLGRTRVCPNETVLYECFVMGSELVWQLPGIFQQYNQNSDKNIVNNTGPISVWLTNKQHLKSTLILTYATKLNNANINCNNRSSKYIIAGMHAAFNCVTYILSLLQSPKCLL